MTTTTRTPELSLDPTAVAARTAIITLRMRKPSARRQAREGSVAVVAAADDGKDPQEDSTSVSLELLRSEHYLAIAAHDRGTRDVLKIAALPSGRRLAPGSFLVPVGAVERLYTRLAERVQERSVLVTAFCDAYQGVVTDAATRLGDAFDVRMFPGVAMSTPGGPEDGTTTGGPPVPVVQETTTIRGAFSIDYELEVSDREAGIRAAKGLSRAFVERELVRARDSGAALVAEIRDGLRVAFADLVERATAMLTPAKEEERKVFRGENLSKVLDFIAVFDERNVSGDRELAATVARAREILRGISPEDLAGAKQKTSREELGKALSGVAEALKPMVETLKKPRRKITVGDDA